MAEMNCARNFTPDKLIACPLSIYVGRRRNVFKTRRR
jgi:hypothetical protein